ncbi:MAG: hypothetical protein KAS72_05150 [Phycisphaerales bacterium]|nr:hypothetical protein [Phycisphaerales bacterium]
MTPEPPKPQRAAIALDPAAHGCDVPTGVPVFTMMLDVTDKHVGDVIPHVPNTRYLHWVEELAFSHSRALGYDGPFFLDRDACFFVRTHTLEYLGEVFAGDLLLMATWVMWFEKSRSERRYLIVREADGRAILKASTVWVYVDLQTRRPKRVPADVVERFLTVTP